MSYTNEELDALCGEQPRYQMTCTCKGTDGNYRKIGPYHNIGMYRSAVRLHFNWAPEHDMGNPIANERKAEDKEKKGKRSMPMGAMRTRLYERH